MVAAAVDPAGVAAAAVGAVVFSVVPVPLLTAGERDQADQSDEGKTLGTSLMTPAILAAIGLRWQGARSATATVFWHRSDENRA